VAPGKALVIMVSEDGQVENRVIDTPAGLPVSALSEASNYLGARLRGRTIDGARAEILAELDSEKVELDTLTAKLVATGLATLAGPEKVLIVRGTSHLLDNQADLDRIRTLFDDIERKADRSSCRTGPGKARVRIFIGSENRLFSLSARSWPPPMPMPRARSWARSGSWGRPAELRPIIPMVDHTAKVIGRLLA
jgi:heat-inducible transcriptional repressor